MYEQCTYITKAIISLPQPQENVVSRNALITLDVMVDNVNGAAVPRSLMPLLLLNSSSVTSLTVSFLH